MTFRSAGIASTPFESFIHARAGNPASNTLNTEPDRPTRMDDMDAAISMPAQGPAKSSPGAGCSPPADFYQRPGVLFIAFVAEFA